MIASPNFESRNGATVRLVVLHTAEGATTAAGLGAFFANPASQVSSHVGIDDTTIEQYVDYANAAWTILSANPISDNAELCGFAAWTRDVWLTQHAGMLGLAARWVRERCLARGIPLVKLTPAQVAAGQAGVIGHWDWTLGMRDGTHTDPGQAFPWDVVISLAQQGVTPAPTPAPAVVTQGEPVLIERPVAPGSGGVRIICPVGSASAYLKTAWISAVVNGPAAGTAHVWFQNDQGGISDTAWTIPFGNGHSGRIPTPLPNGTTQVVVNYSFPQGGTITVEAG